MNYIIEASIQELRSPQHSTRLEAAIRLGQKRNLHALNALLDALYDDANDVLLAVVDALTFYGDDAVPGLEQHLRYSEDCSVRFAAVCALHDLNSIHAESSLIYALDDSNEHVVRMARHALEHLNTPNARRALNVRA